MNSKVEQPGSSASGGDIVKYVLAVALVAAGVFAFYWFSEWATALRALAVFGGLVAGGMTGLFLGAVLLAVGYKIFMQWVDRGVAPEEAGADAGTIVVPPDGPA